MYNILETIIMFPLIGLIVVFNSKTANNYLNTFPFLKSTLNEVIQFYEFICDNNPLLIDYLDDDKKEDVAEKIETKEEIKIEKKVVPKFEDKYLEKFKKFPNEFSFTAEELEQEKIEYVLIKNNYEKTKKDTINDLRHKLSKLDKILFEHKENNNNRPLMKKYDLEDEEPEDIDMDELLNEFFNEKSALIKQMEEEEKNITSDEELRDNAHNSIINKKKDKYIDNYILEHTPLGNIYMRYNNDKKSFEYFSNNTIPYRYLEPVGRKYVMTYWCKPIFVDIEEELKRADEKYEEEKKKKEDEENRKKSIKPTINNPKKLLAQLKNYNTDTKELMTKPMKNRSNANLPPQIKANLPDVNKLSEKQLLKENANRYTWEGRLTGFCPLKKIDKKIGNKTLSMSYADFKKLQSSTQNKK